VSLAILGRNMQTLGRGPAEGNPHRATFFSGGSVANGVDLSKNQANTPHPARLDRWTRWELEQRQTYAARHHPLYADGEEDRLVGP